MRIPLILILSLLSACASTKEAPSRKKEEQKCVRDLKSTVEAKQFCGCFYSNLSKVFGDTPLKDLDDTDKQLALTIGHYCVQRITDGMVEEELEL